MISLKNFRTLFLDRDGVINHRIPAAYVSKISEFKFYKGVPEAIAQLSPLFDYIVVVTNQAGIGKELMTTADLDTVHAHMITEIEKAGGLIDAVYHCPKRKEENPECRKPNPGMARQAQHDFPDIDFKTSIIVGDSWSDMEFGKRLEMATVLIEGKTEEADLLSKTQVDLRFKSLVEFTDHLETVQ